VILAPLLALGAAALYGVASVAQHRAASGVGLDEAGPLRLVGRLVRDKTWLGGKAADGGAFILQALALAEGTLILVQAVLACGLLFALGVSARAARRPLTHRERWGSLALAGGVTILLGVGRPGGGRSSSSGVGWAAAVALAVLAAGGSLLLARRSSPRRAAALLALATAFAFALDGALLKSAADAARDHGLFDKTAVISFVSFVLAAAGGNVLIQRAFQIGDLVSSLPVLTATEPIVGIAFGFALYHERLRGGVVAIAAEGAAIALMLVGSVIAASSEARRTQVDPAPSPMDPPSRRKSLPPKSPDPKAPMAPPGS
jgi:drug/metabolite transporter (DMT)-like permease